MKKVAIAIVLALFASNWTSSLGAQVSPEPPSTSAQAKADPVQEAKLQALQSEVQIFKDFSQQILTTVYFSLGTVVVLLIAMVGFGWYQNFRVYERDKEAMRQALLNVLNEHVSEKVRELDKKATDRFLAFDSKMATALEHSLQRLRTYP